MNYPCRILWAEDDEPIRCAVSDALTMCGYEVISCCDGQQAYRFVQEKVFDLALLDVGLPGIDGFELLSLISKECPGVPVIMATARSDEDDRVRGLRSGADDYVVKPFSIKELLARIEAVLRRSPERPRSVRQMKLPRGVLMYDRQCIAFEDGVQVGLTNREFKVLTYLGAHEGRLVSRDELLRRVWDMDPRLVETKTVEMTMTRLRNKLGDMASCLETVRGLGYRWQC